MEDGGGPAGRPLDGGEVANVAAHDLQALARRRGERQVLQPPLEKSSRIRTRACG
jgi:hypothetical protein